jgi:hypothetical protein
MDFRIRVQITAATVALVSVAAGIGSARAEDFHKLSGSQIRAKFLGMQLTDEVHWGEVYGPRGMLKSYEMGRKKIGHWRIEKDQPCRDIGESDASGCYEVWMAGRNVELRLAGDKRRPLEGVIQKPRNRE